MWRKLEPRTDWEIALAITAALRVVYTGVAAVAAVILHPDARLIQSNVLTGNLPAPGGWHYALLGIWERFDTLWYLRIAERGYDLAAGVVFYPLYPWLIRCLSGVAGPMTAALLISTVAAFFCFLGLLRLGQNEVRNDVRNDVRNEVRNEVRSAMRSEFPGTRPLRTVILAAVWPASFFLFAGYTEALAVALIVWCIVWARDERWAPAAACAFAAGLTRSAGTLVIVPLAIMAWGAPRRARWPVAITPLGTLGYWFWLHQTGRLSVEAAYRTYWNTEVAGPWTTLWRAIRSLAERFDPLVMISLVALIFFFVAGVAARRRMRIEDRCFSAAVILHLLLRLCWPPLLGAPRYLLPVYPAYLTMGEWAEKMEETRFVLLCGALFAFNLIWMLAFLDWSLVL